MDLRFTLLPLVFLPPSYYLGGMKGAWSLWPLQREQGSPFPLHALGERGKLLSPLDCLVAGSGGGVTLVVITAALEGALTGSRENVFPTLTMEHHLSVSKSPIIFYWAQNPNSSDSIQGLLSWASAIFAYSPTGVCFRGFSKRLEANELCSKIVFLVCHLACFLHWINVMNIYLSLLPPSRQTQ